MEKWDGSVLQCNCSLCSKRGNLVLSVPAASFALRAGNEALSEYQFGARRLHHVFCKRCGIPVFSRGPRRSDPNDLRVNINARTIDGVDPLALQIVPYDGRSQ